MGNASSSSSSSSSSSCIRNMLKKRRKPTKTAILMQSDGNTREIKLPVKSGELMIQEFGHVITPLEQLRRTGRVSALMAEEELVAGNLYLLLPVSRLHSKASKFEMAIAETHKKRKSRNNMARVSPSLISRSSQKVVENQVTLFPLCPRFRNQVPWNPVLDTIFE